MGSRIAQLSLVLLVLSSPAAASADDDLDRARALVLQGKHGLAREAARKVLRRNLNDPEALQIVVATSCELGDEITAKLAYRRLAPDVQSMAERHCLRRGIKLTGATPTRAAPTRAAPTRAAPTRAAPTHATPTRATPTRAAPKEATRAETASSSRLPWRIAFWSGLSLVVATLVGAAVLAAKVDALEDDKEDAILDYRKRTGYSDFGSSSDVCAEAAGRPEAAGIRSICDDASSTSTTSNVLFGVSLTVAALSGYFYYRSYIKKDDPPPRVSLSPTLSPTAGGLSLRLAF